MQPLAPSSKRYIPRFFSVLLAIAAATSLGVFLLPTGASATFLWPSSAVGIALLFLYGWDLWPAIVLPIFTLLFLRNGNAPLDASIAIADTIEALIGAIFLRKYVQLQPMLSRLRDTLGLLVACIAPTLIAAIIISVSSYLLGKIAMSDVQSTFAAHWISHAVSALSFAPFLIRWLYRPLFTKNKDEIVEGVLLFGSVAVSAYFAFWTTHSAFGPVSFIYVLLGLLIWAAMRAGPRGTTLALSLMSAIGITGMIYGHSTATHNPQTILAVQVLLGTLDILFLLFTSIVEERKEAVVTLTKNVVQLEYALEKIKSEDKAKTNFLAILAHELRNPLAPIVTSAELLKGDVSGKADPKLIETIETHARTMSLLLEDLLDVSRITQNKFKLREERVLLSAVVRQAVESVAPFIKSRGHVLEVTQPEGEIFIDGDKLRIEQILVNLLTNAGKYTNPGGRITLACSRESRHVILRVSDNGIGIARHMLQGVFEPFGQSGAEVRLPGGLGIGLSLTKQLAELHGGTVEAQSRGLALGSTFTVRLPISTASETSPAAAALTFVNRIRNKTALTTPKIILVVDDNEPAAKGLMALLNRQGHQTHVAFTGNEALEKIASLKPEIAILDIGLPDMSGYELAEKISKLESRPLKLIALTGYGQEEDKAKSANAGFDAHLIKPVSLADVEAVL